MHPGTLRFPGPGGPAPVSRRMASLDGLRGVSALIVVFYHYLAMLHPDLVEHFATGPIPWIAQTPLAILWNGLGAVLVFFVLSGFVIAGAADRRGDQVIANLVTRYFRLALPATASVVLALFWLNLLPTAARDLAATFTRPSAWLGYTVQGDLPSLSAGLYDGFVGIFVTGRSDINNVLWTMKTELFGSMALFVIYWVARDFMLLRLAGLFALAALSLTILRDAYLCFPLGALLYEAHRRDLLERVPAWTAAVALVAAVLLASYTTGFGHRIMPEEIRWRLSPDNALGPVPILAAVLFLLAVLRLAPFAALMSTAVTQWLGRVSFALYLVHVPLLYTLVAWAHVNVPIPEIARAAGYFAVVFVLAHLFTLAVDEPTLRLLRVARKWTRRAEPSRRMPAGG